jgi:hypothetical protein
MSDGDIETYQAGGMWHNRIVGERCVLSSHLRKQDAEDAGRVLAERRSVWHIVRSLVGRVESERRYDDVAVAG